MVRSAGNGAGNVYVLLSPRNNSFNSSKAVWLRNTSANPSQFQRVLGSRYDESNKLVRYSRCRKQIVQALANMHAPVSTTTPTTGSGPRYGRSMVFNNQPEALRQARPALPIPLPKLLRLNAMNTAVASTPSDATTAMLICTQGPTKAAPKSP